MPLAGTWPERKPMEKDIYQNLPTGCCDETGRELMNGDRVAFLGATGAIAFEHGAFGIAFPVDRPIDWNKFRMAMPSADRNPSARYYACGNDHFVSLWEIAWNMDAWEDILPGVRYLDHAADA